MGSISLGLRKWIGYLPHFFIFLEHSLESAAYSTVTMTGTARVHVLEPDLQNVLGERAGGMKQTKAVIPGICTDKTVVLRIDDCSVRMKNKHK